MSSVSSMRCARRACRSNWHVTPESGHGYKQTSSHPKSTSALPPTGDILRLTLDFRC